MKRLLIVCAVAALLVVSSVVVAQQRAKRPLPIVPARGTTVSVYTGGQNILERTVDQGTDVRFHPDGHVSFTANGIVFETTMDVLVDHH